MALCRIVKVEADLVQKPLSDFNFNVQIDVIEDLQEDVVIRCCFIVDPARPDKDVELDAIDLGVGPGLKKGVQQFTLVSPSPNRLLIEQADGPMDVQGMYVCAAYRDKEFCRIGYYMRHEYVDEELQKFHEEHPTRAPDWSKLRRVLSNPTITKFANRWDGPELEGAAENPEGVPDVGAQLASASSVPKTVIQDKDEVQNPEEPAVVRREPVEKQEPAVVRREPAEKQEPAVVRREPVEKEEPAAKKARVEAVETIDIDSDDFV